MDWLFKRSSLSVLEVLLLVLASSAVVRDHWWDAAAFLAVCLASAWWREHRNIDAGAG